jgi:hypothetical protein
MSKSLRITLYDLTLSGSRFALSGSGRRFIYVARGRLLADGEIYEADAGFFAAKTTTIEGEGLAWIYEVAPLDAGIMQDSALSLVMSRHAQPPTDAPRLMRADWIESPSGAATPRHGHRGPGLRRLVYGCLMAEIGEDLDRIDPGHAWFETGHDPVVGTNISDGPSAFVRVMVLPPDLAGGKSSFMPVSPEDARKPRSVTNRLFDEVMLDF